MRKLRVKFDGPVSDEDGKPVPLLFDCPWFGHLPDDRMVLRNSSAPNVIGHRCVKCGCLVYSVLPASQIVGADGGPLAGA
jgi:hypothetical protein